MTHRLLLFFTLFIVTSCGGRHLKPDAPKKTLKDVNHIIPSLKIYIEDGGSMEGFFIDPNFAFSSDLSKLLTNLNSSSKEINLICNNSIKNLNDGQNSLKFSSYLSNLRLYGRYCGESSFEKMLPIVINKADKNTVTIFVSDYIQSSSDLTNHIAGDFISNIISNKIKNNPDFAISILKFNSRFKGRFFYVSEKRKEILPNPEPIDKSKPYYVWVFGDNDLIQNLNLTQNKINSLQLTGLKDFSSYNQLRYDDIENEPDWAILQHTNSIGTFRPARDSKDKSNNLINISNVKPDRLDNEFQISIAIDLSNIPIPEKYKVDINNYHLNSKGFSIQSISKLKGFNYTFAGNEMTVDNKDKQSLSKIKATHIIVLKSDQKVVDNIEISLKRAVSKELLSSNSDNELQLGDSATYGFKNFTDAISKCYPNYQNNSFYFRKKVLIENSKRDSSLFSFLTILLVTSVFITIFILFKKR
jgi:hypothetical protein